MEKQRWRSTGFKKRRWNWLGESEHFYRLKVPLCVSEDISSKPFSFSLTSHSTCGQFYPSTALLTFKGYCLVLGSQCVSWMLSPLGRAPFLQDCCSLPLSIMVSLNFRFPSSRHFVASVFVFCVILFLVLHRPVAGTIHSVAGVVCPVAGAAHPAAGVRRSVAGAIHSFLE